MDEPGPVLRENPVPVLFLPAQRVVRLHHNVAVGVGVDHLQQVLIEWQRRGHPASGDNHESQVVGLRAVWARARQPEARALRLAVGGPAAGQHGDRRAPGAQQVLVIVLEQRAQRALQVQTAALQPRVLRVGMPSREQGMERGAQRIEVAADGNVGARTQHMLVRN